MSSKKYKVFVSSVQKEFEQERIALVDFFTSDILLKSFFTSYIFERNAANTNNPEKIYSTEVAKTDIYIGLLGVQYGYENSEGVSPTENEYTAAKNKGIPRWVYILNTPNERHPKEDKLIHKVSKDVSWKFFTSIENLKKEVYHTCFEFLKQQGKIENSDFDSGLHPYATVNDISNNLIQNFVRLAHDKRGFPESIKAPLDVLKRLFLMRDNKITNSAILMFTENPQQYFPAALVKCAHFHGIRIEKPIPDYKIFSGTILEMAEQTVNFVLDKISHSTGTRKEDNLVETAYEIPREVIAEAVINALAHRDYISNGSVQLTIFKDRIEIENPGHLPDDISLEDLIIPHASYANNPLLAKCLFNVGAIEGYGTGTLEMTNITRDKGLAEPVFTSVQTFKVCIPRPIEIPKEQLPKGSDEMRMKCGINADEIRMKFGVNILKTLELIAQTPEITAETMAAELGLSQRTIENYLAKLKKEHYLERQGSKKDGRWLLIKKEN